MGKFGMRGGGGGGGGLGLGRRNRDRGSGGESEIEDKPPISFGALFVILAPFFWPKDGIVNKVRSVLTFLCVAMSKVSNLLAPLYLSGATNALTKGDMKGVILALAAYTSLRFASSFFKELQGIIFLSVKQTAYIELAEMAFVHVHTLSLHI